MVDIYSFITTWMYIDLCNRLILMVKCLLLITLYFTLYDIRTVLTYTATHTCCCTKGITGYATFHD